MDALQNFLFGNHGFDFANVNPSSFHTNLGRGFLMDPDKEGPLAQSDRVSSVASGSSIIVDQSAVIPKVTPGQQSMRPNDPSTNEPPVKSQILTDHFFRLATKYWNPSDKSIHNGRSATMLFQLPVPQVFFQAREKTHQCFAPMALLQYYRYLRSDFEFVLQANAQPFAEGQLLMYFEPVFTDGLFLADDIPPTFWKSLLSVFNFPHGFLNLFVNSAVRLSVPFTFFENAFDTMKFTDLGKSFNRTLGWLNVVVLNPLRTVSMASSDKIAVTVFGRMVNAEFTGLRPWHDLNVWTASKKQSDCGPKKILNDGVTIQPGAGSMYLSNFEHTSKTHVLGMEPEAVKTDVSSFGFEPTKDVLEYCKIPSLVTWTRWDGTWESGQILFELPVTPRIELYTYPNFSMDFPRQKDVNVFSTNLSATSHLYSAWRGSLTFHFQVVMSNFHRGRFAAFYVPGNTFGDDVPTLCQLQSSRFAVFDLGVESTFSFTVPFMDSRPFVNTSVYGRCTGSDPLPPQKARFHTRDGALYFHDNYSLVNSTGMLYVMVINKLQTTSNVSPDIDINLFMSAGDDFQFFFPVESDFVLEHREPPSLEVKADEKPDPKMLEKLNLGPKENDKALAKTKEQTVKQMIKKDEIKEKSTPEPKKVSKPAPNALAEPVGGTVGSIEDSQVGELGSTKDKTVILVPDKLVPESHTDFCRLLGRAHYYTYQTVNITGGSGQRPVSLMRYMLRLTVPETGVLGTLFSMNTFWRGPINLHITAVRVSGGPTFLLAVMPPGTSCPASQSAIMAAGAVLWDTTLSKSVVIEAPFYVQTNGLITTKDYLGLPETSPRSPTYLGDLVFWPVKFVTSKVTFDIGLSFHREFSLTTKRPTPIQKVTFSTTADAELDIKRLRSVVSRNLDPVLEEGREPWISVDVTTEPLAFVEGVSCVRKEVALVKVKRSFYDHYGVKTEKGVVHFNSQNILLAAVRGETEVKLDDSGSWEVVHQSDDPDVEEHALGLVGEKFKYSLLDQNCEHFARLIYEKKCYSTQSTSLTSVLTGSTLLCGVGACAAVALCTKQGLFGVNATVSKLESVADKASSYLDALPSPDALRDSLTALLPDVKSAVVQKIVAYVCKLTGYLGLVITQHNLSTLLGVLVCIAGDVINECSGAKVLSCIKCIEQCFQKSQPMDDHLSQIAIAAAEGLLDVQVPKSAHKEVSNGVKDFNSLTLAWKNVEFLFQRFLHILSWIFTNFRKIMGYPMTSSFEKNKEQLVEWMSDCQWCIENESKIFGSATNISKLDSVVSMGDHLVKLRSMWDKNDEFAASLRWYYTRVKALQIGVGHKNPVSRPEPIVIMLSGEPGQGKSLLATYIAQDLCLLNGVNPESEVYNKPPNAEFFDGYKGQLVHIIDDIGMDPEDKDWRDFTMMVSTTCFRPNMADLGDKGIQYTSRFVILTTNFPDASPITLRSTDALKRRVLYHFQVSTKKDYLTSRGHLDIEKATKDQSLFDASCLHIQCDSHTLWTLAQVVKELNSEYIRRGALHDKFLNLRSDFQKKAYGVTPIHKQFGIDKQVDDGMVEIVLSDYKAVFKKDGTDTVDANLCPYIHKNPERLDTGWEKIRGVMHDFVSRVSNTPIWLKAAFLAGTAFSLIGLGMSVFMWKKLKALEQDKIEEKQGPYENVPVATKPVKPPVQMDVRLVKQGQNLETLEKISSNIVHVSFVPLGGGRERRMRGLFVGNDVIMVPQHLVELDTGTLTVHDPSGSILIPVDEGKMDTYRSFKIDDAAVDIMFFHVPGLKRHCKKITQCFATFDEFTRIPHSGVLLHSRPEGVFCLQATKISHSGPVIADGSQLALKSVRYTCTTAPGFCGQPLAANYPSGHRIVSMHVAGSVGFIGYGVPVWKEVVELIMNECAPQKQFCDSVSVKGEIYPPVFVPSKTDLKPTGLIDPVRAPAILTDSAIPASFAKYAHSYSQFVPPSPVREKMVQLYKEISRGRPLLTYEQAIYGDGIGLAPLDHQSSAGYPYCLENVRKCDLYNDPAFQQKVFDTAEGQADVTFATFFKDELRPREKVACSKTRLIDAAPLHYTVAFRMAYGHFMSEMHALHGTMVHCMVGCDPEKSWTELYWDLVEIGGENRIIDLDYSGFDASVSKSMLIWVLQVLADSTGVTFPALFEYLVNPRRVFKKWIYETDGGLPSGCPCTSILDSMINTAIVLTALYEAEGTMIRYNDKIKFVTYGDDVILAVSPKCKLTPDILIETAKKFGMIMTAANKNNQPQFIHIRDAKFLKRSFLPDEVRPQLIHPVISEEVVTDLLAWKRKKANFEDNCNQALMFAYHRGQTYFDEIRNCCLQVCNSIDLLTFEDCKERWYSLFE